MKNKKSLLSLGLFALVLVLGVGYAVVSTQNLTIGGTASVAESTLKVSFNGTTATDGAGTITAEAVKGALTADITVTGLTAVGDIATATYTIQNEETDLNASITKQTITNDKETFFEVTTSVDNAATVIEKGKTGTVTVTVKLIKMPIASADSKANISVTLLATPVQP